MSLNQDLEVGTLYIVTVSGLRNPDIHNPQFFKWKFALINAQNQQTLQTSYESTCNYDFDTFHKDTSRQTLQYYTEPGQVILELDMIRGVLSDPIYIYPDKNASDVFLYSALLKPDNAIFSTYPNDVAVIIGTQQTRFQIYSETAIGDYYFVMNKYFDTQIYSNLPVIILHFNLLNRVVFALKQTYFKVYRSSQPITILLELNCRIPSTDIVVKFKYASPSSTGLTSLQADTITFTKETTSGNITLLPTMGQPAIGVFALSYTSNGTNVASYDFSVLTQIQIEIVNPHASPIDINVIPESLPTNIIQQQFKITCNHHGVIYYHVARWYLDDSTQCSRSQKQILDRVRRAHTLSAFFGTTLPGSRLCSPAALPGDSYTHVPPSPNFVNVPTGVKSGKQRGQLVLPVR